jgi:hypothetical protein
MFDVENGECSFCGSLTVVANAEPSREKASICRSCAAWAQGELDRLKDVYEETRLTGK